MARRHAPLAQYNQAKQIAADHNLFISERRGQYRVFRKNPAKPIYLGQSASPGGLFQLVSKLTSNSKGIAR